MAGEKGQDKDSSKLLTYSIYAIAFIILLVFFLFVILFVGIVLWQLGFFDIGWIYNALHKSP